MSLTKQKILKAAVDLFNQKGYVNVSIRDIASSTGISVGNLSYHFNTKAAILENIYQQIITERNSLLSGIQLIPTVKTIHEQLSPIIGLYQKYQFFYLDILEIIRANPKIAKLHRTHIQTQIQYIKAVLDYSVETGNMLPESHKGQYQHLSHTLWMLLSFWLHQQKIRAKEGNYLHEARSAVWNLVIPYLSDKGKKNLHTIYEKQYTISNPKS